MTQLKPDINPLESSSLAENPGELSMDQKLLKDLVDIIESNLKNEQFSVEDLASEMAMSRSHLHRKLRQLKGKSISQFIRGYRLEKAFALLQQEVGTVSEIAFRVGFGSSTYFIKCFHDVYGYSPGEVKRKTKEDPAEETIQSVSASEKPSLAPSPLESLHPGSSESLVSEIFNELVKEKKSLEKYLMVDETIGEQVDIRLLAYQVIKNYPWPIAVELRRLFTGALIEPNEKRYQQLQKTIRRVLKILLFIMISEYVRLAQTDIVRFSVADGKSLANALKKFSDEDLLLLIKSMHEALTSSDEELMVQETVSSIDQSFLRELEAWIEIPAIHTETSNLIDDCTVLEQVLILLLKKVAFLVKYRMVNVGAIEVKKMQFKKPRFAHEFHLLNSSDANFQIHEELMDQFSDSHSVLLMKSVKDPSAFLNLSPFIIDTHQKSLSDSSKFLKRDLFIYDKVANSELVYVASQMNLRQDLAQHSYLNELTESFGKILNLISGK